MSLFKAMTLLAALTITAPAQAQEPSSPYHWMNLERNIGRLNERFEDPALRERVLYLESKLDTFARYIDTSPRNCLGFEVSWQGLPQDSMIVKSCKFYNLQQVMWIEDDDLFVMSRNRNAVGWTEYAVGYVSLEERAKIDAKNERREKKGRESIPYEPNWIYMPPTLSAKQLKPKNYLGPSISAENSQPTLTSEWQ